MMLLLIFSLARCLTGSLPSRLLSQSRRELSTETFCEMVPNLTRTTECAWGGVDTLGRTSLGGRGHSTEDCIARCLELGDRCVFAAVGLQGHCHTFLTCDGDNGGTWTMFEKTCTPVEYARGETGINACPTGQYLITDAQTCGKAATALGLAYNSAAADGDVFALCNWCGDCDPQDVRLDNTHGDGAEWICSNIPTPDTCTLIQCANGGTCSENQCHCGLGYYGTLCEQGTGWDDDAEYNLSTDGTCPEGFRKVSDNSECEWFRDTRFTIRGRRVGTSFNNACNVHWPTSGACFMGPNNNVAYAQHSCNPGAPKTEKFQVICKRNWYNYALKTSVWDGTCKNNAAQFIREYDTWSRFECALHCINDRWCWFFHIGNGGCGLYRSCDATRTLPLGARVDTYRLKIDRAPSFAPSVPPTPLTFSFSVKGAQGSEKIRYNGVEYSLTKTWREFTGIKEDRIEIEFFNDNGSRNVRFDSEQSYNAWLPSLWANWNCWGSASGRNERCQKVQDGKFKWNGIYKIRFFADSDD